MTLVRVGVSYSFFMPFVIWQHVNLISNQPADSAVGCSEIILMAARNIRVFDGRIHVCMEMSELFIPNNLENIVGFYASQLNYVFRLEEHVSPVVG